MSTELYWLPLPGPGRLAIAPHPCGGDGLEVEIKSCRGEGVDVLVSLLTPDERKELGLEREESLCAAQGISFLSFPIPDRGVPASRKDAWKLVGKLRDRFKAGEVVAIHCRVGIGRSALIAACVLVSLGFTPDAAFLLISSARGCTVPDTPEQKDWVGAPPRGR